MVSKANYEAYRKVDNERGPVTDGPSQSGVGFAGGLNSMRLLSSKVEADCKVPLTIRSEVPIPPA